MAAPKLKMRLGDLLVHENILTNEQLMEALNSQKMTGRKLGDALTELGHIDERQLLAFLAKQLDVPRHRAQEYMDKYFERYPNVMAYMEDTRQQASEQGYVETLFGRRLYLPDIKAKNAMRRKGAERAAINAPMQGTAADIIKKAMLAVDEWLQANDDPRIQMTMQVHDELVFEIHEDIVEEATSKLVDIMNNAVQLKVPLIAEAGIGDNWEQAH